jgi:hypothetical protein
VKLKYILATVLMLTYQQYAMAALSIFGREEVYPTPSGTYGVATGDFNNDGWLDVATTNFATEFNGGLGVTVYYNQHGTGFSGRTDLSTGFRTFGIVAADLNGDHRDDLAFATYYSQTISVMYANSTGFAPRVDYPVSGTPWDVAAADFDRDGTLDLAANHYDISVLTGQPAGGFSGPHVIGTGTSGYGNLVAADLNHDGYIDLAQSTGSLGTVQVLYGHASGSFGPSQQYATGSDTDALAVGKLNGDGLVDLAVTNWQLNRITTLLAQSGGGFADPHYYFVNSTPAAIAIADLNNDGRSDLIVTDSSNNQGHLTVFLGQPNGLLAQAESFAIYGSGKDISVGDFNHDGGLDIAVSASTVNTNGASFSIFYNTIPEPSTVTLLLLGIPGCVGRRRA